MTAMPDSTPPATGAAPEGANPDPHPARRGQVRYPLDELLAETDHVHPLPPEQREWLDAPAVGHEVI
jgi:hypothetical protein